MLCALILHVSGWTNSLKATSNDGFFEKLFHGTYSLTSTLNYRVLRNLSWQFYFNTPSFCQKSAERKSPKKYFFHISFRCLTWGIRNPGFASNKPTHYLLDYGRNLDYLGLSIEFENGTKLIKFIRKSNNRTRLMKREIERERERETEKIQRFHYPAIENLLLINTLIKAYSFQKVSHNLM